MPQEVVQADQTGPAGDPPGDHLRADHARMPGKGDPAEPDIRRPEQGRPEIHASIRRRLPPTSAGQEDPGERQDAFRVPERHEGRGEEAGEGVDS